jgi:hypothetical protein
MVRFCLVRKTIFQVFADKTTIRMKHYMTGDFFSYLYITQESP